MDPSSKLINYMPSVGDACLADCATSHTILRDKKYFSNFTLAQSNVHTISGPVNLIKGSNKATIILPKGTQLQIEDALYSNKFSRKLLSFNYIRRNGYHIETMNHDANEYLRENMYPHSEFRVKYRRRQVKYRNKTTTK